MSTGGDGVDWRRVTPQKPCQFCERGDERCAVSHDGHFAVCYRINDGSANEKRTTDGTLYYAYDMRKDSGIGPRGPALRPLRAPEVTGRAGPETLHAIYSALLASKAAKLTNANRQGLAKRGLTPEEIDRRQYRSHPGRDGWRVASEIIDDFGEKVALGVPGIYLRESDDGRKLPGLGGNAGLLIPVRDVLGQVVGLLNAPNERKGPDAPKYRWISSKGPGKGNGPGPGAPVHVPLGIERPARVVRLTEGVLKSDLAMVISGLPTIGVAGVTNWRPAIPTLKALEAKVVRVAYDADWLSNPKVARAMVDLVAALKAEGFDVEAEAWDPDQGKGIDDILAAGLPPSILGGGELDQMIQRANLVAGIGQAGANQPGDVLGAGNPPVDPAAKVRARIGIDGIPGLLRDKQLLAELAHLEDDDPGEFGAILAELKRSRALGLKDFRAAIRREKPAEATDTPSHPYHERAGYLYHATERLSNFTARIVEEVVFDDGSGETSTEFSIEAVGPRNAAMRARVKAAEFEAMKWVLSQLGAPAIIEAERGSKEHVRAAIQHLSGEVPRRSVFTHTGWRKIGGDWRYLHAGGSIGADGLDSLASVQLDGGLSRFELPAPPEGDDLSTAIRASLGLLRMGSPNRPSSMALAAVLVTAPYRAAIGDVPFSLQFRGQTGAFKSSSAALAQQHFGSGMDYRNLPFNWENTANTLEADLHAARAVSY